MLKYPGKCQIFRQSDSYFGTSNSGLTSFSSVSNKLWVFKLKGPEFRPSYGHSHILLQLYKSAYENVKVNMQ